MIKLLVSIPEDSSTMVWLEELAELDSGPTRLEVGPDFMHSQPASRQFARRAGFEICTLRSLLPPEIGRNLEALTEKDRNYLVDKLQAEIAAYGTAGIQSVTIDLGVETFGTAETAESFMQRVRLVRRLLPMAEGHEVKIFIPVRYPLPYPGSNAWDIATNLVHDIMHPACRLAVNLYTGDIESGFDIPAFARRCAFHLGALRFVYNPMLGESIGLAELNAWMDTLQWLGYNGQMVFAPRIAANQTEAIHSACQKIDRFNKSL